MELVVSNEPNDSVVARLVDLLIESQSLRGVRKIDAYRHALAYVTAFVAKLEDVDPLVRSSLEKRVKVLDSAIRMRKKKQEHHRLSRAG